jgi:hypothetical protein
MSRTLITRLLGFVSPFVCETYHSSCETSVWCNWRCDHRSLLCASRKHSACHERYLFCELFHLLVISQCRTCASTVCHSLLHTFCKLGGICPSLLNRIWCMSSQICYSNTVEEVAVRVTPGRIVWNHEWLSFPSGETVLQCEDPLVLSVFLECLESHGSQFVRFRVEICIDRHCCFVICFIILMTLYPVDFWISRKPSQCSV